MSDPTIESRLEARLGRVHARQRLGLESEHEHQVFRSRTSGAAKFFHPENWYSIHALIRLGLRSVGLFGRAQRNARDIHVRENTVTLPGLPAAFHGYRLLHLSDLHIDVSEAMAHAIVESVRPLEYDLCVLTGDYRFRTTGAIDTVLHNMERLRGSLSGDVYAVLGNHDTVRMVPAFEAMGIRVLMNEHVRLEREGAGLYLAGIDDAHYFGVDNFDKALGDIPVDAATVLLSHTPEVYRRAAHAAVDLMLCGHTHGGQLCLPGGYPIILDARIPRWLGRGAWRHGDLQGYTSPGTGASVVEVRLNCPAEVTLHRLVCTESGPAASEAITRG